MFSNESNLRFGPKFNWTAHQIELLATKTAEFTLLGAEQWRKSSLEEFLGHQIDVVRNEKGKIGAKFAGINLGHRQKSSEFIFYLFDFKM